MSPDDIDFFDIGEQVVVKIGETTGGEVRLCIVKVVDIIFITDDDTIKVQQYSVKFTNKYDNYTCWYDACDVFKNIYSLMEYVKRKKNKTKGK